MKTSHKRRINKLEKVIASLGKPELCSGCGHHLCNKEISKCSYCQENWSMEIVDDGPCKPQYCEECGRQTHFVFKIDDASENVVVHEF